MDFLDMNCFLKYIVIKQNDSKIRSEQYFNHINIDVNVYLHYEDIYNWNHIYFLNFQSINQQTHKNK